MSKVAVLYQIGNLMPSAKHDLSSEEQVCAARAIIANDKSETARTSAWALLNLAIQSLENQQLASRSAVLKAASSCSRSNWDTLPSSLDLWRLTEELEAICLRLRLGQRGLLLFTFHLAPKLLRDLGVALVTTLVIGTAYLYYNDLPINIWSDSFRVMDVEVKQVVQGFGKLQINETVERKPIMIGRDYFSKGLGTHADSDISIKLSRDGRYFSGACGYPDAVESATIKCSIEGAGRLIWESDALDKDRRLAHFKLELSGLDEFRLLVKSQNSDVNAAHAVWVDLKVSDE